MEITSGAPSALFPASYFHNFRLRRKLRGIICVINLLCFTKMFTNSTIFTWRHLPLQQTMLTGLKTFWLIYSHHWRDFYSLVEIILHFFYGKHVLFLEIKIFIGEIIRHLALDHTVIFSGYKLPWVPKSNNLSKFHDDHHRLFNKFKLT